MRTASILAALMITASPLMAQDLTPAQVPAAVMASFNKEFPKAMDVEWDLKGTQYKVEFETGLLGADHEAWYDANGKQLKHKEEISVSDLPAAVSAAIARDFDGYRTDDVERITQDGTTSYTLELKKLNEEWEVAYDAKGMQLEKRQD
ncbi:MAG: PepSY-like domain-containing protein [Flavobacteriales bacterium]|nr:PepSY-like domain-containing protein [Flavobacteriales bacterium]MCB0757252.1 PepSY-like domain-containing protein [Flavobacteriales bacterium]